MFHQTSRQPVRVLAMLEGGQLTEEVGAGVYCGLVLDKTSFYAEGGGQAPDKGTLALRLPLRSGCSEVSISVSEASCGMPGLLTCTL